MSQPKKNIVIIGAGFAGVYSARSIAKEVGDSATVTLINKNNHFLFTPLLHEIATGGLGHHQAVEALRHITYKQGIRFIEGHVRSIQLSEKKVLTDIGGYPYDMLVVALGATTNFYDIPGAREHAIVLKDLSDAMRLRDRIIELFEKASNEPSEETRKRMLSFVVVGGGATGVELAAEIAEFANRTLSKYYKCQSGQLRASITLVQRGTELLPGFHKKSRVRAQKSLMKKGVRILLNAKAAHVEKEGLTLETGEQLFVDTVVWNAGVRPHTLITEGGELTKDARGRILTERTLAVEGWPDIFALGDIAHVSDERGEALPMLAQVAVSEAGHLGKNIGRILRGEKALPFRYHSAGELVSLGQWEAVGTIYGINVHGALAWFIWRTTYLFKFISHSKKIKIAVDWTVHIFFRRDITRA